MSAPLFFPFLDPSGCHKKQFALPCWEEINPTEEFLHIWSQCSVIIWTISWRCWSTNKRRGDSGLQMVPRTQLSQDGSIPSEANRRSESVRVGERNDYIRASQSHMMSQWQYRDNSAFPSKHTETLYAPLAVQRTWTVLHWVQRNNMKVQHKHASVRAVAAHVLPITYSSLPRAGVDMK